MSENIDTQKKEERRIYYYDILNVVACVAVVILHHNGMVWSFSDSLNWKSSLGVECIFYWAVPVFLMLSGANLMEYRKKYTTKEFFIKRIKRTVIPWVCWSLIILVWKTETGQMELERHNPFYIANLILTNKVENVYWFFIALFGIYLAIPVLSRLIKYRMTLWYIVVLNFIFVSVIPVYNILTGGGFSIAVPFASGLVIFPILGYLLSTMKVKRNYRILLYISAGIGTLFRFIYTYDMSCKYKATDSSIKGYEKFYSVLLAAAVFILVKEIPWDCIFSEHVKKIISILAANSFGIYLLHRVVMYYEQKIWMIGNTTWEWRFLGVVLTYVISLAISIGIGKIPVIKCIIGK